MCVCQCELGNGTLRMTANTALINVHVEFEGGRIREYKTRFFCVKGRL